MGYVIGIDGGTESLRAHVFDLEGHSLGTGASRYETHFPAPGQAEQDAEAWWQACGVAVRDALKAARVDAAQILALCADTTCCTVVACDKTGQPLRPALLWMDVRAHREAEDVVATGDSALRVNSGGHGPVSPEWMIPKALWMKRNQPEIYEKAARICEYQDYLNWRLTGRWCVSLNNISVRWHYQAGHGGWPKSLLARLDATELMDRWPRDIVAPGEEVAGLTQAAATHLGLPAGTRVIQGGADAFIGMIGLNVVQPGELALITGSSHLQLGVAHRAAHARGVWGTYADAVYRDRLIIEGGQTSTGSVLAWFKRNFAADTEYDALNAAAEVLPPGAEGLLAQDHFQGNRTPHTDALSRGAITGLTLKHTQAHVYRALVESICMGTRLIVDTFGESFSAQRIVVAGGATHSPFWLQVHADTLGLPLELPEQPEAPALGCAILAAYGAGRFDRIEDASRAMVRIARTIEPDMARHEAYAPIYDRYRAAHAALRPLNETR